MTITKSTSTHNTQALNDRKIEYIVIHYTAGVTSKGGSAANTANYYKTTSREVSSDYTVDDAGAVLYNPDIENRYTWHCGGTRYNNKGGKYYGKCKNSNSIGIEICSTNTTGKMQTANSGTYSFSAAAIANAVELTKQLMKTYGIDASHVIRHYDVTGKLCPGIKGWNAESGSEAAWNNFKNQISGTNKSVNTSTSLYRVRKSWADATSQIGAYSSLDNAKKSCKAGYTVYDEKGNAVYATTSIAAEYKVKVTCDALNIRAGAGTSYAIKGCIRDKGTYTIVETKGNWGRLKSGAGWICLDYTKKV